ncbi:5-cytosine rRNA methyltransferase NSUN4-like [Styela clava]
MKRVFQFIIRQNVSSVSTQIRYKHRRPEWYQYRRPTEPHELAREFFDGLYSKRFVKDWPSIRCAMMSRKKYAAVVNNHTYSYEIERELEESGAIDIVSVLHNKAKVMCELISKDIVKEREKVRDDIMRHPEAETAEERASFIEEQLITNDKLQWLNEQLRTFQKLSNVCYGLKVYAYPKRNLTEFVDAYERQSSSSILNYFLLDGSSILPILALDPQSNEHILDACAAPGGKLMCIMQICKDGSGSIIANDISSSRVKRLKNVQNEYIPKNASIRERIKTTNLDAAELGEIEPNTYDKVLVDVPCTNDRDSILSSVESRDNIFSELRKRERANLPQVQSDILRSAILSCRPGGTVVYSTCTASLQQNEYVVQMTIQQLLHTYGISCEIENLTPLTNLLKDYFHYFQETELGILTLPFLEANFGPAYMCKIIRTR